MKTKTIKTPKLKKPVTQGSHADTEAKPEVLNEDGFAKSKVLSPREIENLKDQLETLNRENTSGG